MRRCWAAQRASVQLATSCPATCIHRDGDEEGEDDNCAADTRHNAVELSPNIREVPQCLHSKSQLTGRLVFSKILKVAHC